MSLNQPKKLFVSSDDADYADDDTSDFSVTLSQPIHNAQSVRLVSAVYPSSVYNVEDGDTLRVNESYYTSDGTKLSSVQFVLSVPSGNYTGDTLATAITTASQSTLVGTDVFNTSNHVRGSDQTGGTLNATAVDTTLLMLQLPALTTPQILKTLQFHAKARHPDGVTFQVGLWKSSGGTNLTNVVVPQTVTSETDGNSANEHRVDLEAQGVELIETDTYWVGLYVTNYDAVSERWASKTGTAPAALNGRVYKRKLDLANSATWYDSVAESGGATDSTIVSGTTAVPTLFITTKDDIGFNYNDGTANDRYCKLNCTFDSGTKRFSFEPQQTAVGTFAQLANSSEHVGFLKKRHPSNLLYKTGTVAYGYLEVPTITTAAKSLDRDSLNYRIGAALNTPSGYSLASLGGFSGKTSAQIAALTTAQRTLTMRHIARLIKDSFVYLLAPGLVNDSMTSQNGIINRTVLARLPLTGDYGAINIFHTVQGGTGDSKVTRLDDFQTLHFRLVSHEGQSVRLGGSISLELCFQYE
jgi:hypothetical protein